MPDASQDHARATSAALRMLSRREHGRRELAAALRAKGFPAELIADVLQELQSQGLQSDRRFAAALVRRRIERGYGPAYIRAELRQRQVEETLADAQLNKPDQYWLELAAQELTKKFPDRARDQLAEASGASAGGGNPQYASAARFLARRGFPAELVHRLLR